MKMYISKNQVVKQGNVTTDKLVVHGQLIVAGKVKARSKAAAASRHEILWQKKSR